MDILFVPLLYVCLTALNIFQLFVFVYVVLTWLEFFGVVNRYNRFVYSTHTLLFRLIEPLLIGIRRFMPQLGQVDLSPIALLLMIYLCQGILTRILLRFPS